MKRPCELTIYKHLYNNLISNSLLYNYQSGFTPGHSTVHHLIELIHRTYFALETMKFAVIYSVIYPKHLIVFGIEPFYIN